MKRLVLFLASALGCLTGTFAAAQEIRDIDITLDLYEDGSARVTEVWDVTVDGGTEWYLVRNNLGVIRISGLSVSDETGRTYRNIGDWDVDRSLEEKAFQCGINQTRDGCELCWGVGSYGDHQFTVSYRMSNVVDAYSDYDALHLQLVSPDLSSPPQHVKVQVRAATPLSSINTRAWGFGFAGTSAFEDGGVTLESTRALKRDQSVILLLQLNKGLFQPARAFDNPFSDHLERAMNGASFSDDPGQESLWDKILSLLFFLINLFVWVFIPLKAIFGGKRHKRKKVLGCKLSEIGWCRDLPFGGNLLEADYVLGEIGEDKKKNTVAGAMILRMIKNGNLLVSKDSKDRIEISFNDAASQEGLFQSEKDLYQMLKEASGADVILQDKEFSRWSSRHSTRVSNWVSQVRSEGRSQLGAGGYLSGGKFTESGKDEARKVIGFRKYLSDFTIIGERASQEVALWHEYLIFATLYGIADQVAKELKDINPQAFEQVMTYDYVTMSRLMRMTGNLADSITTARVQNLSGGTGSSRGGFGGFTSIGGGGGFSGGGSGGGSR